MRRNALSLWSSVACCIIVWSSTVWAESPKGSSAARAVVVIHGFSNPEIHGVVTFAQKDDMTTRITGKIRGLTPGQTFAIHVHQWGDCRDPKASGGHFDPYGSGHHGNPDDPIGTHHSGDLLNIEADQNGVAQLSYSTKGLTVFDGPASVLGHAVVLHEHADDYSSQPAGNAGSRIACGVIGLVGYVFVKEVVYDAWIRGGTSDASWRDHFWDSWQHLSVAGALPIMVWLGIAFTLDWLALFVVVWFHFLPEQE